MITDKVTTDHGWVCDTALQQHYNNTGVTSTAPPCFCWQMADGAELTKWTGSLLLLWRGQKRGSLRKRSLPRNTVMSPRLVYRGGVRSVRDCFPALKVSHGPPGLSLVFSWNRREEKKSPEVVPNFQRAHCTHTHGWCRAQVRWLDPLASAAPYLHREASTRVARNTRQASGCASGRVLLHIVGPFLQLGHGLAPGGWLGEFGAAWVCVCVCVRGGLYSPSRKCFCVGTRVGGVPGGSRRGRCERRPIGGACEFLQLHRDVRTVVAVHLMNTVHSWENI